MKKDKVIEFDKEELKDALIVVLTLTTLFSMTFHSFTPGSNFVVSFGIFFFFFAVMTYLKLLLVKWVSFKNAFRIYLKQLYVDRYWVKPWDKFSYHVKSKKFKGIPMSILSLFLYVMTLGFFIFPIISNFRYERISHRLLGDRRKFENINPTMQNWDISDYRLSLTFFVGFIFYIFFGLVISIISPILGEFYWWFLFAIFWVAILNLIPLPLPLTEGFNLWIRSSKLWWAALVAIITGLVTLLIFKNLIIIVLIIVLVVLLTMLRILWKEWV